ncbi:hypothetical protein GCM10009601_31530 [Streptomyces thermospinosisporus]|uniref:Uncharacterized protein n=1 Tax=Streptomyces thermospinosisporus TaxID=161482 RepID=A0ABN1YY93_9ACTN
MIGHTTGKSSSAVQRKQHVRYLIVAARGRHEKAGRPVPHPHPPARLSVRGRTALSQKAIEEALEKVVLKVIEKVVLKVVQKVSCQPFSCPVSRAAVSRTRSFQVPLALSAEASTV